MLSEAYWRSAFAGIKRTTSKLDINESQRLKVFHHALIHAGGQRSPWSICEDCSEFFTFDRDKARSYAARGAEPPECGPVDPSQFTIFAAAAWEHVFGRWPATVQQPEVDDSCDLCAKKIYRGEVAVGHLTKERFERLRADGIVDNAPLSPPRPEGEHWVACVVCLNRILAKSHRAKTRPE
ncbi:MAG: hypothetical protein JOZ47_05100 [Kutzneria sp.]|nr:hypothetical protein [Kutzneria sp.]